jgi:hypothetical protein
VTLYKTAVAPAAPAGTGSRNSKSTTDVRRPSWATQRIIYKNEEAEEAEEEDADEVGNWLGVA